MAAIRCCALGMLAWMVVGAARAADPITLREAAPPGSTTKALVGLSAQGLYQPANPPGSKPTDEPKSLSLKVETRLEFVERVRKVDTRGVPTQSVRRATRAGAAINGEVRPSASNLRPEVATLVAEVRPSGVEVYSPGGPLTRSELDLVQGPGDPLALYQLLPDKPVALNARWKVSELAARSLSGYDLVTANQLEATLAAVDAESATVRLGGEVRGSALGGEGSVAFNGSYTFDRKANRLVKLNLERAETRRPGPVEAGLDVRSTLTVTREAAEPTPSTTDEAIARLDLDREDPARTREQLLLTGAEGRFQLIHDRDWHTYWDDNRLTVLKRLGRGGEVLGQCNLAVGPNAGKGRHQDLNQFREDVKRGLGGRFSQFLGAGEVEGDPAGHFRYKIGVQGRQGDVGVVWYYYLIAGPEGDQVVGTFTLPAAKAPAFGNQDERLIGSFRWTPGDGKAVDRNARVEDGLAR